jgi:hypothetical protein
MTTTARKTIQTALDTADPNVVADLLRKMKLGTMMAPLVRRFTSLTASATFDLTAIDATGETVGPANPKRKPVLLITALQIIASGTATSLGAYIAASVPATPIIPPGGAGAAVGVATISDDGKTITFPNTVTAFTIIYMPRSDTDVTTTFPTTGLG